MIKNISNIITKMTHTSARWSFNWSEWTPTEKEFQFAVACLQLDEKERIGRFVFKKDVKASLIGRLMMKKFINEYANIPYNEILLTKDENNRPMLQHPSQLVDFNVSHQGNYTVFAGELGNLKIGVDVMKREYSGGKSLSEFFRIMNRNFTINEWTEIKGPPGTSESEQIAMFVRHWALKESYSKALGCGITVDLDSLDFRTTSKLKEQEVIDDTVLEIKGVLQDWIFEETLIDSEHCVAVTLPKNIKSESRKKTFERLDFNQLMANAVPIFECDRDFCKSYFSKDEKPIL
ncbi:L-aminoadipate-semialdehyde dehydrogenase-phosphopantetheinyl transferase [Chelonus insularis]|uniref:L-aminoadipate-semialdehyde dehydrogenase-phosphopantetheinyl transferase n=1 Tax=Chelonus insularis TaxID=460826 RepID=UPI00158B98A2|nr:L-aminoadipate-semialdehyde dehydrogenase-phosphopantetheinyl transferase [Chelonus insularis]